MSLSSADRLDILELLARADNAATARDVATYVELFSEQGILDGEKGQHIGRPALTEAVRTIWASEGPHSVHLTLNPVIAEIADHPDQAEARSMMMIVNPGPPPTVMVVSAIVQHVERTPSGWRISRRTVNRP